MPGPPSAIETPLNTGFIRKNKQTGHTAQKPMAIYTLLIEMVTKPGDMVFYPMCGSGTTGAVYMTLGCSAVLSYINPEYISMTKERLQRLKEKS